MVHLRYGEPGMALAVEFFGPLGRRSDEVLAGFSDAELETVRRFLDGMTAAITAHLHEMRDTPVTQRDPVRPVPER